MRHILFILVLLLTLTSCATNKGLSNDIVYDAHAEMCRKLLQRSKDAFFATDSANVICNDLGWVKRLLSEAKISDTNMPSVFKRTDNDRFTMELPCWEFDTDEFWAATVVVEHKQLDSAIVNAKIQGVDDIFMRVVDDYADYMRKAQFSCLCLTKGKKKYLVNATILIPKKEIMLGPNFYENLMKLADEYKNLDTLEKTENAEKP